MWPTGHCVPDSHGPPGRGPTMREGGQGGECCGFCRFKWEGQPLKDREPQMPTVLDRGTQPSLGRHCHTSPTNTQGFPGIRGRGDAPGPSFSWQVVPTPAQPPQPLGQEATSPGSTWHGPQSGPRSPRVLPSRSGWELGATGRSCPHPTHHLPLPCPSVLMPSCVTSHRQRRCSERSNLEYTKVALPQGTLAT